MFDAGKGAVLKDDTFVSMLHEFHASADDGKTESPPAWHKTLKATLFELHGVDRFRRESHLDGGAADTGVDGESGVGSGDQSARGYVMISYSWEQQDVVLQVRTRLQAAGT